MNEITEPDFKVWAENMEAAIKQDLFGAALLAIEVEVLYKQSILRGRQIGFEEGYKLGLDKGWAIEQDKDNA